MALTLADLAVLEERKLRRGILAALAAPSVLTSRIPFENSGALNVTVVEMQELPAPAHRLLNASSTAATGDVGQRVHGLKILSNYFEIDRQMLDEPNMVQKPEVVQTELYTRAVAYEIADLFINGDAVADPAEPSGLAWYFANDGRLVNQVVDGGGLDIDADDTNRKKFIDLVEETLGLLDGGTCDIIVANRQTIGQLSAAARNLRLLDSTKDQFDRRIRTYDGIPLVDAGVKPAGARLRGATDQVISAANGYNEMYFVKFGNTYVTGIQKKALEVINLGISNSDPTKHKVFFEWAYNPCVILNHYGVALLKNLDTGAA